MKRLMTCAVLLALATVIAGCGASGSTSSAGAAASVGAATNADVTPASGATTAAGTPVATPTSAAATPTSAPAAAGGDTCKFLSASDAAALVANPGPVKVAVVDGPISKVTSCTWGSVAIGHIFLVANELNSSAPASDIKAAMVSSLTESIGGLGDVGGFMTKTSTDVTVAFFKGTTQVTLAVSATSVNADAVVAAAKKSADGI
jgi:hypothetical protein